MNIAANGIPPIKPSPIAQGSEKTIPASLTLSETSLAKGGIGFSDILAQINRLTQKKVVSPQELLAAQVACHRYQLHVEMISKCAEGSAATIRKLQQGGG